MELTTKRRFGWKLAFVTAAVAIGGLVSAIPAEAAGGSKVVASSDDFVKSQCRFTVQGLIFTDTATFVRFRLTAQATAANFANGHKIAFVRANCEVFDNTSSLAVGLYPSANRRSVYKSELFSVDYLPPYTVCSNAEYVLKDGTFGSTPVVCN
jgi:hypothetical protein